MFIYATYGEYKAAILMPCEPSNVRRIKRTYKCKTSPLGSLKTDEMYEVTRKRECRANKVSQCLHEYGIYLQNVLRVGIFIFTPSKIHCELLSPSESASWTVSLFICKLILIVVINHRN